MKPANYAPVYAAALYPQWAEIARTHGYALAVHGSLARDFDLIAVPWVDEPGEPQAVLNAITSQFAAKLVGGPPSQKPHGRLTYTLSIGFGECYADLSFMPRAASQYGALAAASPCAAPCTCHPDDNPPRPCPQKYAYSECAAAAQGGQQPGDLHPQRALEYARQMKAYCESFDGRDWPNVMLHGSVDAQNLAHALDNLMECAAMLMNMASRVAAPAPAAPPSEEITEAMLRAADEAFKARDMHAARVVYAGIYRAMRAVAAPAAPLTEEPSE